MSNILNVFTVMIAHLIVWKHQWIAVHTRLIQVVGYEKDAFWLPLNTLGLLFKLAGKR